MGEKYSKEDHDKCKKVAEVFQELYDMLGDTCVLDAGEFGFVYFTYYREQKSCFDRNKVYRNAEELFEALWDEWLYSEVMQPVYGTEDAEAGFEEIYRKLPDERAQVPIIAMTANAFEEDRQAAFAAGMDDYLAKPIEIDKLLRKIVKVLEKK